jgi:hypothetical protein
MNETFKKIIEQANNSKFKNSGNFYEIKDGKENKIKILTAPVIYWKDFDKGICFEGCNFKGSPFGKSYVLDLIDNTIKVMDIKYTLLKKLGLWEESEDYTDLDGTFPMKLDIRITKTGSGKTGTSYEYDLMPKPTIVSKEILEELEEKENLEIVIDKLKSESQSKNVSLKNI